MSTSDAPKRILICNDDGASAPGLALLARAAATLCPDVWVVGPERKWTAASHQISFDRDLTLTRIAARVYACSGAPADCVVAAMTILLPERARPDLVLAGINDKRNVGEDVAYSGTMAIAREATFWGVPAIALSRDGGADRLAPDFAALCRLIALLWGVRGTWALPGLWLSANLPERLPAPLEQAVVARDKIGSQAEVRSAEPDRVTYRLRRGRPGTAQAGDENALIAAGKVALVRNAAYGIAPLDPEAIARWNTALTREGGMPV